ncbi:hypothetical protein NC652_007250 [Populus alba x Populus x berolinensis]|nr:hypothetical protein NC652_007250 [Populus alba x Populus x berolinensis]
MSSSCLRINAPRPFTEHIPPVLQAYPSVSKAFTSLDLLTAGSKSDEIHAITAACTGYIGCVGDETLLAIAANCLKLRVWHLVDMASLGSTRGEPEDDGCTKEDARISKAGLVDFFAALPLLQELVLDVYQHVREALHSKCPELKLLKLGQFHGFCVAIETQLDGVGLCSGLESLSVKTRQI